MKAREDKKKRILDAAEAFFAKKGFHSVGMRDIAMEVGLHSATLYHYFPNKESLYFAVIERTFASAQSLINDALAQEIESRETLKEFIEAHFDFIVRNESYFKIILHELNSGGPYIPIIAKHYIQPLIERLRMLLGRFENKDLLRPIEPQHILLSVLAVNVIHILFAPLIEEILEIPHPFPADLLAARKKANIDLILHGILKEGI